VAQKHFKRYNVRKLIIQNMYSPFTPWRGRLLNRFLKGRNNKSNGEGKGGSSTKEYTAGKEMLTRLKS